MEVSIRAAQARGGGSCDLLGTHPPCATLPYDSSESCTIGGELHVSRTTYELWKYPERQIDSL
jgi:hypothetical protein